MPATTTEPKFNCSTCGKEYRWKPELAGKKAKCKCGNVITVPAKPPAAAKPKPRPAEDDLDGLYALAQEEQKATSRSAVDENAGGYRCPSCSAGMPAGAVICPNCQLDMRTGMRMPAMAGAGAPAGAMAAAGAYANTTRTSRVLAYGGGGAGALSHAERASRDIAFEGGKVRSLYLPIGLIVLGILFYFGQVAFANNKLAAGVMVLLVFGRVILDSVLIFIAMLIAVKGFDMGFGAFGPGMLKILAIALGPGALGEMVEKMVGGGIGGILVGAFVTIVLYFTLIKVLFNLDLGETFLLVFLIYGVRRVLGTFLIVAITGMASSGMIEEDTAGAVGVGTVAVANARSDPDEFIPPKRAMDPEEIAEGLNKSALGGLEFVKGGSNATDFLDSNDAHKFSNMDKDKCKALVKDLTDAGAVAVTCSGFTDIATPEGGRVSRATELTIELPDDKAQREKIFAIRKDLMKSLNQPEEMIEVEAGGRFDEPRKQEPLKDWGQKYLVVSFGDERDARFYGETRFSRRLKELEAQQKAEEEEKKAEAEDAGKAAPDAEKPAAKPDAPADADKSDDDADDEKAEEAAPF